MKRGTANEVNDILVGARAGKKSKLTKVLDHRCNDFPAWSVEYTKRIVPDAARVQILSVWADCEQVRWELYWWVEGPDNFLAISGINERVIWNKIYTELGLWHAGSSVCPCYHRPNKVKYDTRILMYNTQKKLSKMLCIKNEFSYLNEMALTLDWWLWHRFPVRSPCLCHMIASCGTPGYHFLSPISTNRDWSVRTIAVDSSECSRI